MSGKRILVFIFAILLIIASTGCIGSGGEASSRAEVSAIQEHAYVNPDGLPICNETITLHIAAPVSSDNRESQDRLQVIWWREVCGIDSEWALYSEEEWPEARAKYFASNNLPDLLLNAGLTEAQTQEYGAARYLADLNRLSAYMPNLQKNLDAHEEWKAYLSNENGAIFGISRYVDTPENVRSHLFLRKEWLDATEMSMPENVWDLRSLLSAFKQMDINGNENADDEIPAYFGTTLDSDFARMISEAFGVVVKDFSYPMEVIDGEVTFAASRSGFRSAIAYMADLYANGLLDAQSFTDTPEMIEEKVRDGQYGLISGIPHELMGTEPEDDRDFLYLCGLVADGNEVRYVGTRTGVDENIRIVISSKSEYKEAAARLVDYYACRENQAEAYLGPIGIAWEYLEEPSLYGGKVANFLTSSFNESGLYASDEQFRTEKAVIDGTMSTYCTEDVFGVGQLSLLNKDQLYSAPTMKRFGALAVASAEIHDPKYQLVNVYSFPVMSRTEEEAAQIAAYKEAILPYYEETIRKFITGEMTVDGSWAAFTDQLNVLGLEELVALEQQVYDRYALNLPMTETEE